MNETRVVLRPRNLRLLGPVMPKARPPASPSGFHAMAKPTGAICNLDCQYCFYLSKEELYPGGRFRMSEVTMENYIRQLIEAQNAPEVTIAWQGGEPTLMGLAFFRKVIEVAESYRRPGQRLLHTLQTNATLLTEEWACFLAEHDFLVGVSIDGPPAMHDAYRVDKKGQSTLARVLRGLRLLQNHRVEYNVLCTVNTANVADPLDVYRFLRDDCAARFIQFIPIVEHIPTPEDPEATSECSVNPVQWGRFLNRVFEEWLVSDVGSVFIQSFDAALASWLGLPTGLCVFEETCGNAVALEHNGDVYSCDHFVEPEYLLGNITHTHLIDLVGSQRQRDFGQAKRDTLPRYCLDCDVRFACWGECPKNRFCKTTDGELGLNYLCAGYKEFFHRIDKPMRIMAELVRAGRPASDVIAILKATPRNKPCLCGSGRKTKHCHGDERHRFDSLPN